VQDAPGGAAVTLVVEEGSGRNPAEIAELKKKLEMTGKRLIGLERKLLEETSVRQWAEEEIARRDKVFARLYLEQEEQKLLSPTGTRSKALTVMFLDLIGFSKLNEVARQEKVDMLRALGSALLPRLGGMYINTWGDAIVAGFDYPNDGLFLACKFIQHLRVEKIEARIGMSRGKVMLQYNDLTQRMDIAGDSVNVGARLEPMAHTGEVLISEALRYHPDVEEERFIFTEEQRALKKAVGDQQQGDLIECYSVKLVEETKK
jgi:class 3 adenylate cyclase